MVCYIEEYNYIKSPKYTKTGPYHIWCVAYGKTENFPANYVLFWDLNINCCHGFSELARHKKLNYTWYTSVIILVGK